MVNSWQTVMGGCGVVGAIAFSSPAWALCSDEFAIKLEQLLDRPELAYGRIGLQVETLAGEAMVSREGDRFFVPASTLKLVTTAAALTELGPDYYMQTLILGTDPTDEYTTLQLLGAGDPSFEDAGVEQLAEQLVQEGVNQVDVLYGNEALFPGEAVNPNWEWEDVQAGYGAPVNALILNLNEIGFSLHPQALGEPLRVVWEDPQQTIGWSIENYSTTVTADEPEFLRVGRELGRPVLRVWGQLIENSASEPVSIAEPHPGQAFLDALQGALMERGIVVQQTQLATPPAEYSWQVLATVESPSLAELLKPTNQASTNVYAEALLKTLGAQSSDADDATEAGIEVVRQVLQGWGIDTDSIVMVDGSGLARKNLITPETLVEVLRAMARSPHADVYQDSLAIAGVTGTLRNRLQDTPAEGRLYGKTGAISRNFALAGYLNPDGDFPLAFSLFLNNVDIRGSEARRIIDDIVLLISQLENCSPH